jgi:hypothetical protein
MRREWLALCIGVAITVIAFGGLRINSMRKISNGEGGVTYTDAYPQRIDLSLPGLALMVLAINLTPVMWGSHPMLAQAVVATGNFIFYSVVAYVALRVSAKLSAKWRRQ